MLTTEIPASMMLRKYCWQHSGFWACSLGDVVPAQIEGFGYQVGSLQDVEF